MEYFFNYLLSIREGIPNLQPTEQFFVVEAYVEGDDFLDIIKDRTEAVLRNGGYL